jgi:hypothetical protein
VTLPSRLQLEYVGRMYCYALYPQLSSTGHWREAKGAPLRAAERLVADADRRGGDGAVGGAGGGERQENVSARTGSRGCSRLSLLQGAHADGSSTHGRHLPDQGAQRGGVGGGGRHDGACGGNRGVEE